MTTHDTREAWLRAAAIATGKLVAAIVSTVPTFHVSVGFPKGARGRGHAVGQCWDGSASADGSCHVFVSPELVDPTVVLAVLLHEQIHAAVGCAEKHRGAFAKTMKAVGMVKPWTTSTPGPELLAQLGSIAADIGAYPHAALAAPTRTRTGSRLRLWECRCPRPVKVRVASDEFAATCDHCGEAFEVQA